MRCEKKKGNLYFYQDGEEDFVEIMKSVGVKFAYMDSSKIIRYLDNKFQVEEGPVGFKVGNSFVVWNKGYRISKLVENANQFMKAAAEFDLHQQISNVLNKILEGSAYWFFEVEFSKTGSYAEYKFLHPNTKMDISFYVSKKKCEYRFSYDQNIKIDSSSGYQQLWEAGKELEKRHLIAKALEEKLESFEFVYYFDLI